MVPERIDSLLEFSNAQSVIGLADAAINSTKAVDIGSARAAGAGSVLWLVIRVKTQILAAGGAANVTFKLIDVAHDVTDHLADRLAAARKRMLKIPRKLEDSQADMASGLAKSLWSSGPIAKVALVAGAVVCCIRYPRPTKQHQRVTITPDTNDTTAGTVDAFVTTDPDAWQAYGKAALIL